MFWKSNNVLAAALVACACFAAFWQVVVTEYGYNDDYLIFDVIDSGHAPGLTELLLDQGRPLAGIVNQWVLSRLDSISDLRYIRTIGLIFLCLFGYMLYRVALVSSLPHWIAVVYACLAVTSPPFAVYASWAILFTSLAGSTLALLGGQLLFRAWDSRTRSHCLWATTAGCLLVFAALNIYQSIALIALVPVLAQTIHRAKTDRNCWQPWACATGCILATLIFYRLLYMALPHFLEASGTQSDRASLATEPLAKFIYAAQVLWSSALGWGRFLPDWPGWIIGATVLLACSCGLLTKSCGPRWLLPTLCALLLPISIVPILVIAESNLQYRTQAPLHLMILLIATHGIAILMHNIKKHRLLVASCICGLWLTFSITSANLRVQQEIVKPSAKEWNSLRLAVASVPDASVETFVFLSPQPSWLHYRERSEFGVTTSTAWWNIRAMLRLALVERFPDAGHLRNLSSWELKVELAPVGQANAAILDVFSFFHADEYQVEDHVLFGPTKVLASGWRLSPWFGSFFYDDSTFVWHPRLGATGLFTSDQGDYFFLHEEFGLFVTNQKMFPTLLLNDGVEFKLDLDFWRTIH